MSKHRVLHIYKDYWPPVLGGIEKHLNIVCHGIDDEFEARVLVANRKRGTERENIDGVDVVKASCLGRFASAPMCPGFPRLIREWPADILHFHHPNPTGDISYLWSKPPGKVAVTWHSDVVRQQWAMRFYGPLLRRFLKRADVIMPTSPNYIEISPWLWEFRNKCVVVPLGIDLSPFDLTPGREKRARTIREHYGAPIIIFCGVLRYYKGLHFLIEAMRELNARCLIVGDGPEREHLQQLIWAKQVGQKVHLLSGLDDAALADHLYAADVFCLPSQLRAEAFGLAQIEGMACGLPVVATRLDSGVPFVNRECETGLLAEPGNWRSLRDALRELLDDEDRRNQYGAAAKRRARELFSSERMVADIKRVYRALLEGGPFPDFVGEHEF